MDYLPIDAHIPEIINTLKATRSLVLTAPPGAGKTTRIPRALLDAGFADKGEILVLEPRRLAARMAAARIAEELGERTGETVGYSIRFENVSGPKTRIKFLTEAILSRRIISDPDLQGVTTVILDEFHERQLSTDLALAFLKQLQKKRTELNIIVMSATMESDPVTTFLSGARFLSVASSPFNVTAEYEEKAIDRPLHEKIASSVSRLVHSGLQGDILAFLPGAAEIRRSTEALAPHAERLGLMVVPLHGDLPLSDQKRAIAPAEITKVILATNVAETSITIPGISVVIDSGLARIAGHSAWSGFPTLSTMKISRSSARQRAGRAGRTREGRVLRLYTKHDLDTRSEYEVPEIKRADLTETALMLHGAGIQSLNDFSWFEAPLKPAVAAAEDLLSRLGAIDATGLISETGKRMLRYPVHPRLARLIVESDKLNVAEEGILLASLLSERDIRIDVRAGLGREKPHFRSNAANSSDLLELLDRYREAESAGFAPERLSAFGLDSGAIHSVRKIQRQLSNIRPGQKAAAHSGRKSDENTVLIAILAAFPDRVAKRRKTGSRELLLAGGGSATLSAASVVHTPLFITAIDVEERKERTPSEKSATIVRLASAVEIDWLAGLFPDSIIQDKKLLWNDRAGRVDEFRRTTYGQIVIEETVAPAAPSAEATLLLVNALLSRGLSEFPGYSSIVELLEKLTLLSTHFPEEHFLVPGELEIHETIMSVCGGIRSLEEISSLSLITSFIGKLTHRQRSLLERETPERIQLKAGRKVKIHYEAGKPPWIESRLQDFFGMFRTPSICVGRVPLTIHLLAPNGRSVQVTRDLEGFWEHHYPVIRKELGRRYPKHSWPEPKALQRI
jgi:ATP-dependent helicase HrpB